MNFSNKFKKNWWTILLIGLTVFLFYKIYNDNLSSGVDSLILIFWFILVMLPIISEISFFGISVKKDLEEIKGEMKNYFAEIKSQINFQPIINISTEKVGQKKYKEKVEEEIEEEIKGEEKEVTEKDTNNNKKSEKSFKLSPNSSEDDVREKISKNEYAKNRLNKILEIEKLISNDLRLEFKEKFKSQVKIIDSDYPEKNIIVDGVIYRESGGVEKIIEIKFITKKSIERYYYIALSYIKKITRLGLRIPLEFIIVSEEMDKISAKNLKEQIAKINYQGTYDKNMPHVSLKTILFKDNELKEIYPE